MGIYTLNICGWRKEESIPDYLVTRGTVRIALPKPLEVIPREKDIILKDDITTIDLRWNGKEFIYD
jgi:hypothetical protein